MFHNLLIWSIKLSSNFVSSPWFLINLEIPDVSMRLPKDCCLFISGLFGMDTYCSRSARSPGPGMTEPLFLKLFSTMPIGFLFFGKLWCRTNELEFRDSVRCCFDSNVPFEEDCISSEFVWTSLLSLIELQSRERGPSDGFAFWSYRLVASSSVSLISFSSLRIPVVLPPWLGVLYFYK